MNMLSLSGKDKMNLFFAGKYLHCVTKERAGMGPHSECTLAAPIVCRRPRLYKNKKCCKNWKGKKTHRLELSGQDSTALSEAKKKKIGG